MAIIKSVASDDSAATAWTELFDRWDAFSARPEYLRLDLDSIARPVLDFFEEKSGDPIRRGLARELRTGLAGRMAAGDIDQLVLLVARKPEGVNSTLATISKYIDNNSADSLIKVLLRYFRTSIPGALK